MGKGRKMNLITWIKNIGEKDNRKENERCPPRQQYLSNSFSRACRELSKDINIYEREAFKKGATLESQYQDLLLLEMSFNYTYECLKELKNEMKREDDKDND